MQSQLNPSEISELIKGRIEKVKLAAEARNEGTITSVADGIVRIHGLVDVMAGEMIEMPGDTYALALNLERDSVGAVVLGDYEHLRSATTNTCAKAIRSRRPVAFLKCRLARRCWGESSMHSATPSMARAR